jgi:hypothetical protein
MPLSLALSYFDLFAKIDYKTPIFLACAVIFLSFWAEVHYNSIYPEGGKHLFLRQILATFGWL